MQASGGQVQGKSQSAIGKPILLENKANQAQQSQFIWNRWKEDRKSSGCQRKKIKPSGWRHDLKCCVKLFPLFFFLSCFLRLRGWRGGKTEERDFLSATMNEAHLDPLKTPPGWMHSFASLVATTGAEWTRKKTIFEYSRIGDTEMRAFQTGRPAEQCFRSRDLRECLYIVNFDTTIETDTFLWRSLRLIWCSCQGAKRGAAGNW